MRIVDFARYAVCRSFGDREVFKWTGSHDRIRLLADLRADASFATIWMVRAGPAARSCFPGATLRTNAVSAGDANALHRRHGDSEGRRLVPPYGDKRVSESAGSHDRIRLVIDARADDWVATESDRTLTARCARAA
jgi:hypothetical protein